jgi:hypothetical protein
LVDVISVNIEEILGAARFITPQLLLEHCTSMWSK